MRPRPTTPVTPRAALGFVLVAIGVVVVATSVPSVPVPLADNGPIVFVRTGGREADLLVVDAASGVERPVVAGRGTVSTPAWSRDGRSLAYAGRDPTEGGYRIRVVDDGRTNDRALTPGDAIDGSPSWSPDADRIAYSSNRGGGGFGIFLMRADGSDTIRLTDGQAPAWSPTGRWIVFVRLVDGQRDLFLIRPDGQDLRRLTTHPAEDVDPAWSPDGSAIVFARDRGETYDLYRIDVEERMSLNEPVERELYGGPGDDRDPAVSPDGTLVAFSRTENGSANLWLTDGQGAAWRLTDHALFDVEPAWQPQPRSSD